LWLNWLAASLIWFYNDSRRHIPMLLRFTARSSAAALLLVPFVSIAVALLVVPTRVATANQTKSSDPWTAAQVVQPSDLAPELADKTGKPSTILYVGFRSLFAGGHIPEAVFHGTSSTEQGLANLRKWAGSLPRSTSLILYCGCCPFEKCPNVRPAFTALNDMGFTKLRVLVIPTSFASDWADKGYVIQKGQ
jgi:thiosulfate/3-mercaptopyruvate sulfurtransferase